MTGPDRQPHADQARTVLVIGGASNLGWALAARLHARGDRVVIASRDRTRAEQRAATLGDGARGIGVDLTDEDTIAAAAAGIGSLDHVVVTAADHHDAAVTDLERAGIVAALEAKVVGPLLVAKHFAPRLASHGSLLFFSGVAAWQPTPGLSLMGITNGAISVAATQLAAELAPIRVNAVSPGIIDSGAWDAMAPADRAAFFEQVAGGNAVGRVGCGNDVVDAAVWLLDAGYVSGQTIRVDGGAGLA